MRATDCSVSGAGRRDVGCGAGPGRARPESAREGAPSPDTATGRPSPTLSGSALCRSTTTGVPHHGLQRARTRTSRSARAPSPHRRAISAADTNRRKQVH